MKYYILIASILFFAGSLFSQETRMIDEIKAHKDGIGLWWAGHNGWIIKSGDLVICTDIILESDMRAVPTPITAEELAEVLDISFATHWHGDHFNSGASKVLLEKSDCIFVLPESCLEIAEELQIPKERIQVAKPRVPFELMGLKVDPLRAIHGNANFAIYYQANMQDCGYVINVDGVRFLQPGDSYLLEDHLFLEDIDVLFFSPTEHNMYIDRSVILINTLNPEFIFPQHHSTIEVTDDTRFWAKGYQHEVKIRLTQALKDKYYILKNGESVRIR